MTTLTIKINERTKAGKAFLEMTKFFAKDTKGVEIVDTAENKTYSVSKNIPNAETIEVFKDTDRGEGLTRVINSQALFEKLGI